MTLRQATTFLFTTSYEECEDRFTIDTHNSLHSFLCRVLYNVVFLFKSSFFRLQRPELDESPGGATGGRREMVLSCFSTLKYVDKDEVQLVGPTSSAVTSLPQGVGGDAYTGGCSISP